MYRSLAIFLVVGLSCVAASGNYTKCNDFNANFDLQKIIGQWYVVAIATEPEFSDEQKLPCYEVEFTEFKEVGLRWLMNMTNIAPNPKDVFDKKGIYILQRYHSEHSLDVWYKSLANGCFQQAISFNTNQSDIRHALSHEARMQLHVIQTGKDTGPFLLQILWDNHITGGHISKESEYYKREAEACI